MRFIRKGGRIIPIGDKGAPSDWKVTPPKTTKISVGARAKSGAKAGFKLGAGIGAVSAVISGAAIGRIMPLHIIVSGARVGVLGAALGAAAKATFGPASRTTPGRSQFVGKKKK